MPVQTEHPQYGIARRKWDKMRPLVEGQDEVKRHRQLFLPMPETEGTEAANEARYEPYLERALYTNYVGRTRDGLVGAVFRKDAEVDLPDSIDYLIRDTDGGGLTLEQLSKAVVGQQMETGRAGLLADYPESEPGLSREQVAAMNLRPTIARYRAEDIINWQSQRVGGNLFTTLVVLRESIEVPQDEFTRDTEDQWRVLIMVPEVNNEGEETGRRWYEQRVYDHGGRIIKQYNPRKADGSMWEFIPFVFVGSENNHPDIDRIPLYDIAMVNVAHYRNSADYEEGVFIHGQPTLNIDPGESTDPETWKEYNPNGVKFGSRSGILTPGGSAKLLQAEANSAASEAMEMKEGQIIRLGAKLITDKGQNETAEAARINAAGDNSVLSNLVGNASEGIRQALWYCSLFVNASTPEDQVVYELNQDFFDHSLSPQEVMALIQLADRGDIGQTDIRNHLRKVGWVQRTDEEIDDDVASQGIA